MSCAPQGLRMTNTLVWSWVDKRHLPKGRSKKKKKLSLAKRTLLQLHLLTEHFRPHLISPTSWWLLLTHSACHFPCWCIQCRCWAASRLTGVDWWLHSVNGRCTPSVKTATRGRLPHIGLSVWNKTRKDVWAYVVAIHIILLKATTK